MLKERQVYEFIQNFIVVHHYPPTSREVSEGLFVNFETAKSHIKKLYKKNVLLHSSTRKRGYEINTQIDYSQVDTSRYLVDYSNLPCPSITTAFLISELLFQKQYTDCQCHSVATLTNAIPRSINLVRKTAIWMSTHGFLTSFKANENALSLLKPFPSEEVIHNYSQSATNIGHHDPLMAHLISDFLISKKSDSSHSFSTKEISNEIHSTIESVMCEMAYLSIHGYVHHLPQGIADIYSLKPYYLNTHTYTKSGSFNCDTAFLISEFLYSMGSNSRQCYSETEISEAIGRSQTTIRTTIRWLSSHGFVFHCSRKKKDIYPLKRFPKPKAIYCYVSNPDLKKAEAIVRYIFEANTHYEYAPTIKEISEEFQLQLPHARRIIRWLFRHNYVEYQLWSNKGITFLNSYVYTPPPKNKQYTDPFEIKIEQEKKYQELGLMALPDTFSKYTPDEDVY